MKITIEFATDNAAFVDEFRDEVRRVLKRAVTFVLLRAIEGGETQHKLYDSNGNAVGNVTVVL